MRLVCAVAICFLGCFFFSVAFGCVYTVRDVGFADIGSVPYRLYYYVQDDMPEELVSTFKQISYAALMDSNVEAAIINVDQSEANPDDHAMKYLKLWNIQSYPTAILVSPEGRSLVLPMSASDESFKETVWSTLEEVVISPERKEILSLAIETYCAVLLVQGENAAENKRVRKVVDEAIQKLSGIMGQLPKSIENPPSVIVIPPETFSQERILLWSLGLDDDADQVPYVAVIYGRGRRIGDLLEGDEITANRIFNILSIIGGSCECGIDREWLLGTMMPLRWDEKAQAAAAKDLGFDVENPMVKTEMSQILSRGISGTPGTGVPERGIGGTLSPVAKYSETVVDFGRVQSATVSQKSAVSGIRVERNFSPYQITLIIVGGIVLLVLAVGVSIILLARRRTS